MSGIMLAVIMSMLLLADGCPVEEKPIGSICFAPTNWDENKLPELTQLVQATVQDTILVAQECHNNQSQNQLIHWPAAAAASQAANIDVCVQPRSLIAVVLKSDPGTGYSWFPASILDKAKPFVSSPELHCRQCEFSYPTTNNENNGDSEPEWLPMGAGGMERWWFHVPIQPGVHTIQLAYVRPWAPTTEPSRLLTIHVQVV